MEIEEIVNVIDNIKDRSALYLVETLSESAGFFSHNGCLLYIVEDTVGYSYEEIETEYLRLETHIYISSVDNASTYKEGEYNIITYKGKLIDRNLSSFIKLCEVHACNKGEMEFRDFFYSLISMFKMPKEQSYKNAIGLYGELKFMQISVEKFKHDISNSWHKKGSYTQYDFSNGEIGIEVKSTTVDQMSVLIKHQQIFEEQGCWLVAVICKEYENGETIKELIDRLLNSDGAFKSIGFRINLVKELNRVSTKEVNELRLKVQEIRVFDANEINPFPSIPDVVDKLEYRLDISEMNDISQNELDKLIHEF